MITPQDMPTLAQSYEATTQLVAKVTQQLEELELWASGLQEEAKNLEDGSDRVRPLINEHDAALNQIGDAGLRLRDANELMLVLQGEMDSLGSEEHPSWPNACLVPLPIRKRTALETYLCKGTSKNLAAAKGENLELLARVNAALADSE